MVLKIKPKKGETFLSCSVFEGKVEYDEWVVYSIQNRSDDLGYKRKTVYLRNKVKGLTWVKRSKKHFDWGWSDRIPSECRRTFVLNQDGSVKDDDLERFPCRTRLQAARACLKVERYWLNRLEEAYEAGVDCDNTEYVKAQERAISAVKRAIKRERAKR